MHPYFSQGSALSVHRAFVVHFRTETAGGRRRFAGRVEHLTSGQTARFSSLKELAQFFADVLDAASSRSARGP
jgi:hypothetical protein